MSTQKILTLEALAERVAQLRSQGRKVAHCHGCFDLLHIGHIRHFQQAKSFGDVLIVTLTPDRYVNKGPGRPAFSEELRLEALAALDVVDFVALNRWPQAVELLKLVKPNFYVKGIEYKDSEQDVTGGIVPEREAIESVGGELVFTDDIVFSSSSLINQHLSDFPKEVTDYLAGFARRYSPKDAIKLLQKAEKLKVLVIGETIIDEYQYCEAIGKSSKEPTLAVRDLQTRKFAGGILAVANNVSSFCENVGMITQLGDVHPQDDFIREHLNPKVKSNFLIRENSPTIVKKRIIEHYFFTKMLEIYTINDALLGDEDNRKLCAALEEEIPKYDMVIVVDFGHSMMTREAIEVVTSKAKIIALNVQTNAGNMGYNMVSKYPRADYITLAEKEMRLEARDPRGNLESMVEELSEKMNCPRIVVTRGRTGSLCYERGKGFNLIPAFAKTVVDRVGAGDAFLSVSSLCMALDAPMELVGFVGNMVGAWAVSTVCNEKAIDKTSLYKQIETILK
jgi:rfaE bifunctional protein kinase chain/domain/rfaE bifunctional protein nucleotidyltransferase chain/domain